MRRGTPKAGDVVMTTEAPLGEIAQLDERKVALAQRLITLRGKKGLLNNDFLKYLMISDFVQHQLQARATGTTVRGIRQSEIRKVQLLIPEYEEQKAIAAVLSAFDDKIELNRQMNATLEEISRALFKSWFVDFDPVRRNQAGQPSQPYDHLFPGRLVVGENGRELPEGWHVGTIGEDFHITMGQSPPGDTYNEEGNGLPFYQGRRDFGFRYPSLRVYCSAPKRLAKAGDTLVSVRAPVGDINMAIEDCCIGRGVGAIRHKSGSRSYTFYAMKSLEDYFSKFEAEGTVFGSLNKNDFHKMEFLIPSRDIVKAFEQIAFAMDQLIETNEQELLTLSDLRDTLLPRLMSGQLRVPEQLYDLEVTS